MAWSKCASCRKTSMSKLICNLFCRAFWAKRTINIDKKACAAGSATSLLTSVTIPRRDPTDRDVQIEILLCGICHSDLHYARDEWHDVMSTVYPYGGYSDSIVVDEGFVLHIPANAKLF